VRDKELISPTSKRWAVGWGSSGEELCWLTRWARVQMAVPGLALHSLSSCIISIMDILNALMSEHHVEHLIE